MMNESPSIYKFFFLIFEAFFAVVGVFHIALWIVNLSDLANSNDGLALFLIFVGVVFTAFIAIANTKDW
jgi:hypothetical protein